MLHNKSISSVCEGESDRQWAGGIECEYGCECVSLNIVCQMHGHLGRDGARELGSEATGSDNGNGSGIGNGSVA